MLTRFSQSLLRPGGGWAQPFCRAFELHCHFVVKENPFCRMGGLVLLQNEWLRPHRGNWKGDPNGGLVSEMGPPYFSKIPVGEIFPRDPITF